MMLLREQEQQPGPLRAPGQERQPGQARQPDRPPTGSSS
jgi:hypothetical protein